MPEGGEMVVARTIADSPDPIRLGGIGNWVAAELERRLENETRATILGHLQRGGIPTPFDRVLGTRFGVHAVRSAVAGERNFMAALRGNQVISVPLHDAIAKLRRVDPAGDVVQAARSVGTTFGD
jgi:6-phosphofructokinase 1